MKLEEAIEVAKKLKVRPDLSCEFHYLKNPITSKKERIAIQTLIDYITKEVPC